MLFVFCFCFFFFNDTATTEIYTLSLHDALPIFADGIPPNKTAWMHEEYVGGDRKSTRLNSSHITISYAVFCLKKKKTKKKTKTKQKKKTQHNQTKPKQQKN